MYMEIELKAMKAQLISDITSDVICSLAAEISNSPLLTNEKMHTANEW